ALPIIEGTVVRLVVEKPPSSGVNKPAWLWWPRPDATTADGDRRLQSFLRRFDIEHTFRLFKQTLDWAKPRLRSNRNLTRRSVGRVLATGEAYSRPTHHRAGTKPRRIT
ncbi:hypothetical protein ACWDE9_41450, partial [Streptomyces olivaceoviridis]